MHKERAQDIIAYVLGFKPVKTVVQRLLIISLHIVLWGLFLTLPLLIYRIEILDTYFLYRELINKSFLIILFYFHYYYLIPKFFRKRRLVNYFLSVFATLILICIQQLTVEYYFQSIFRKNIGFSVMARPGKFIHRVSPVAKAAITPFQAVGTLSNAGLARIKNKGLYGAIGSDTGIAYTNSEVKAFFDSGMVVPPEVFDDHVIWTRSGAAAGGFPAAPMKDNIVFMRGERMRQHKMLGFRNKMLFTSANAGVELFTDGMLPPDPLTAMTAGTAIPIMAMPFTFVDTLVDKGIMPLEVSHRSHFKNEPITGADGMIGGRTFSMNSIPTISLFGTEIPLMALPMLMMDTLTSAIIILLISGFIKLANSLLISEKQKKALENQRLNAELNFLKLQINPHFLFNTLNSIYSQAHLKSEQTEYSILKFSQIMRYVLYDSATEKIPLAKDLEYVRNYIDLQKLRISKNVTIHYGVTGNTDNLLIAPLLLITFIENAFKHGISYTIPSEIRIHIEVIHQTLVLSVGNAVTITREKGHGGVGLINAKRRLDVLYPGRYMLDVVENNSLYIVNLKIDLDYET